MNRARDQRAAVVAVLAIAAFALSRRASARIAALVVEMVRRKKTRRPQVMPTGPGGRWELPGPHADVAGTGAPPVAPCAPDKRYTALHYRALATQAAHERLLDDLERVVRGVDHLRTPVTPDWKRRDRGDTPARLLWLNGAPFVGKRTLAARLRDHWGATVLDAEAIGATLQKGLPASLNPGDLQSLGMWLWTMWRLGIQMAHTFPLTA